MTEIRTLTARARRGARWSKVCFGVGLALAVSSTTNAATLTALHDFDSTDGGGGGLLAQGRDGSLYAIGGHGTHGFGFAFRLTPDGGFTKLHDFDETNGGVPAGGLTLGRDGNFYGTTVRGGTTDLGTVFKMTPAGAVTVLHHFRRLDGCRPDAAPIQASDRNLYGTARACGANDAGTVYKITTDGAFSVLHSFGGGPGIDGTNPSSLIQGADGALYGTTAGGGGGRDTVFKITTSGVFSKLYSFFQYSFEGIYGTPGPLIQGTDGNLYGTTADGGAYGAGSVFKLTLGGDITELHIFDDRSAAGRAQGYRPLGGLVQGGDGNFYGAAILGGDSDGGVLFRVTPEGEYTVQAQLDMSTGEDPSTSPFLHTNGKIYGMTVYGGAKGWGTAYHLDVGAPSFIRAVPGTAKAGQTIGLLGAFGDAAAVTFNGLDAPLSGTGANYHTAVVPAGAATGLIEVTTPAGTTQTLKPFQQRPAQKGFSPHRGAVGSSVVLNGTGLTQTTEVLFGNGKSASFVVNSDSQITATVPVGAATGNITVTTQGGRFSTLNAFTVKP